MSNGRRIAPEDLPYVVDEVQRRLSRVEERTEGLSVMKEQMRSLKEEDMPEIRSEVSGLRRALITFTLGVTSGSLLLAFAALVATGKVL